MNSYSEITGTLRWEPEIRFTQSGVKLAAFSIRGETGTVSCIAWEEIADAIYDMNLKKGEVITVSGQWKSRKYNGTAYREYHVSLITCG